MKIQKLKCPNCGANIEYNDRISYCSYCGTKLLIDDGTKNINLTYKKIDDARIKESQVKENIRLKELENEEKERVRIHKYSIGVGIISIVILISIFFVSMFMDTLTQKELQPNEIKISTSSADYIGENYVQVVEEFRSAGFINVDTIAQYDLILGLITKDGTIERISIAGDTEFVSGDIFTNDSRVLITYRTLKKNAEN